MVSASAQSEWRVEGPGGESVYRPRSVLQTNSAEVIREAIVSGLGIGMHSTWNIGAELRSGVLKRVLPQYSGTSQVGIYAIYAGRRLVPAKVRAFVDYLAEIYGPEPYWDLELDAIRVDQPLPLRSFATPLPCGPVRQRAASALK